MTYTRPPGEDELSGGCAFGNALCTWAGPSAYVWAPADPWHALSTAPTAIDSGFTLQSGLLAGADTHVGFLPSGASDWAWWHDLSAFTDAHPMFGDLLLCPDSDAGTYTLFSIAETGLDERAHFKADDVAEPLAGWSPPTNPERLLLLGTDGLWALDPPYTPSSLQPLVSFDDVELPAVEDISGPFHSGAATVIIPRRARTALRLDLSDGSGQATGIKHLMGDAALWAAYLQNEHALANRLLATLTTLPTPDCDTLHLHDVLVNDDVIQAVATSAGVVCPDKTEASTVEATAADLRTSPLDGAALTTWGLWLEWENAVSSACRQLCSTEAPNAALVESLRRTAGATACQTLFDLLQSDNPPTAPSGGYDYPLVALRSLAASLGTEAAASVEAHLSVASAPARRAACAMAGALPSDAPSTDSDVHSSTPALWDDRTGMPIDALRANAHHEHPAVRTAARDSCIRLGISVPDASPSTNDAAQMDEAAEASDTAAPEPSDHARRSVQSSQPESPK